MATVSLACHHVVTRPWGDTDANHQHFQTHAMCQVQALYRGNGANVARLIPDVGFKFAVHDQFKLMFSPPDGSPLGVREKMAAGAATGKSKH